MSAPRAPRRASLRTRDVIAARPEDFGYSRWRPRIWHGMTLSAFARLMQGNLTKVAPGRIGLFLSVTLFSFSNFALKLLTRAIYGRRIDATTFEEDPIFILGHWRSGTTLLHQMMMSDPRFATCTTAQVFIPEFFPLFHGLQARRTDSGRTRTRPMDAVEVNRNSAEEDEMALVLSGAPSTNQSIAFPLDKQVGAGGPFKDLTDKQLKTFRKYWLRFLRSVQFFAPGKRLALKSPGHTLRIAEILHHFPNAKFVHIVRDPYEVTMSFHKASLAIPATQSFQTMVASDDYRFAVGMEDYMVFQREYWRTQGLIPAGNLAETRFEDLVSDPIGTVSRIYEALELGNFAEARPHLESFVKAREGYVRNTYDMTPEKEERIWTALKEAFEHYGYTRLTHRTEAAQ